MRPRSAAVLIWPMLIFLASTRRLSRPTRPASVVIHVIHASGVVNASLPHVLGVYLTGQGVKSGRTHPFCCVPLREHLPARPHCAALAERGVGAAQGVVLQGDVDAGAVGSHARAGAFLSCCRRPPSLATVCDSGILKKVYNAMTTRIARLPGVNLVISIPSIRHEF